MIKPRGLSVLTASLGKAQEWTAVRVPGPPSRQPRFHCTVPRGKSWHATALQVVDVRRRRCRKWLEMNEPQLSATDAALRQRITELSVHIPCGALRGPIYPRGRWQSCADEDSPDKWEGHDVSQARDLCLVCARGTAGGSSRWAWLACDDCRSINAALESAWGFRPLALGRHSLMNGIGVRGNAPPEVAEQQLARLAAFVKGLDGLYEWRRHECWRLAAKFDPLADIPLWFWQQEFPASRCASADAFSRLLERELPSNCHD
jgi:hypothetical protein